MIIKYYFYLAIAFIAVFVAAIFTIYRGHMAGAALIQLLQNASIVSVLQQ